MQIDNQILKSVERCVTSCPVAGLGLPGSVIMSKICSPVSRDPVITISGSHAANPRGMHRCYNQSQSLFLFRLKGLYHGCP